MSWIGTFVENHGMFLYQTKICIAFYAIQALYTNFMNNLISKIRANLHVLRDIVCRPSIFVDPKPHDYASNDLVNDILTILCPTSATK